MLFLISYKFTDANAQDRGSKMLKEWYEKGGPQNRPEGYDVKSWISYLNMAMVTLQQMLILQKLYGNSGVLGENYWNLLLDLVQIQTKQWLYIVDETLFNCKKKRAITALIKNQYYLICRL